MVNEIKTRYLTRKDQVDLFAFMRFAYRPGYILTNEKFFEWYTHSPRLKQGEDLLPVIGAFWGEKLVGHMFVIPHYFNKHTGEKLPMVWNSNFMVHPEFQQKGIGPLIVKHIFDDPDIFVSAGTGASLQQKGGRSLLTAMGYLFTFMQKYIFLFGQEGLRLFKEEKPGDKEMVENRYSLFKSYLSKTGVIVINIDSFDDRLTEFWQRFGAPRFYGTWRDADFLNWRYFLHPIFEYRAKVVLDGQNKVRGFGVYRLSVVAGLEKPVIVARMTEFLVEESYGEELLSALLKDMEEKGVLWVDFFTTTKIFEKTFISLGFITDSDFTMRAPRLLQPLSHVDPVVNLVAKNIRDKDLGSDFNDFAGWYSTCADGDQDRPNAAN